MLATIRSLVLLGAVACLLQEAKGAAFDVISCQSSSLSLGRYKLDGNHGKWPASGFCRAISKQSLPVGSHYSYQASAFLNNIRGRDGGNMGHLGLAYNAINANNFDFVYFRPHSAGGCFQTGYVSNGVPSFHGAVSSTCPGGPPRGATWFQARVVIHGRKAKIYLNNRFVREVNTHYKPYARGGVIVANGYNNIIYFKNFKIKPLSASFPFLARSCLATAIVPGYFLLDASHGTWPASGFCRTLHPQSFTGSHYRMSARLNNLVGRGQANFGHLGLMYNAIDINNFDFVYFRPHSVSGCFQTGYVRNGVPHFAGAVSSTCPNGPPRGGAWFEARVEINGNRAQIYRDTILVATVTTHYPAKARGGVIVANGYGNVVFFSSFKLQSLQSLFPFSTRSCRAESKKPGYYELDAAHGRWPASGFCRTFIPRPVLYGPRYSVSAQLYNYAGWNGISSGHLGLMYNARDINNFEFVYFRPHSISGCYQTGYVENGVPKFIGNTAVSRPCLNGPPVGRTWFKAEVRVNLRTASIHKDGVLIGSVPIRTSPIARGGVIVANGYGNIVRFRDYKLRSLIPSLPFTSKQCVWTLTKGALYQLRGKSDPWPTSGFCRALYRKTVPGSRYTVSVQLYNVKGSTGGRPGIGHLGLMYNAKDINNFDFVYFRPHSAGGCFQLGFLRNNRVYTSTSSSCSNGPPATATWFNLKVAVSGSLARIYRDGVLVTTVSSNFPALGRGGVIVANGYNNVVDFRRYNILKN